MTNNYKILNKILPFQGKYYNKGNEKYWFLFQTEVQEWWSICKHDYKVLWKLNW